MQHRSPGDQQAAPGQPQVDTQGRHRQRVSHRFITQFQNARTKTEHDKASNSASRTSNHHRPDSMTWRRIIISETNNEGGSQQRHAAEQQGYGSGTVHADIRQCGSSGKCQTFPTCAICTNIPDLDQCMGDHLQQCRENPDPPRRARLRRGPCTRPSNGRETLVVVRTAQVYPRNQQRNQPRKDQHMRNHS